MKRLMFASFFALTLILFPQSNVDKVTSDLESIVKISIDNWKISPDLGNYKPETIPPFADRFDDSKWSDLTLNQRFTYDSCWIRKEFFLPASILGKPVSGKVIFKLSVDDFGYMYIDGEYRGKFPWNGEFVLTENAKPGQRFLLAVRAVNTGGPLRLISAEIESENTSSVKKEIEDLVLSLRTGQKLLSFDTYQTNARQKVDPGIDNSKMRRDEKSRLNELLQQKVLNLDIEALRKGNTDAFISSMEILKKDLVEVKDFAKRFTLFFSSNAHIDAAWLWRSKETVEVAKNTFSSVLKMMEAVPDFTYSQSSAVYYDWMEKMYPDIYEGIKKRVDDGRWEITGGMWIEPDCNLIGGESWMRHLLYAKKYFRTKFGKNVKIGWNPDSFGYNLNMPMFYNQARIEYFITQKIGWNETNVFPHRVFWWESPDGSRLFTYFPFDYVNEITEPLKIVDWLRQFEANTSFTNMMVLFGVGDHGGGPSMEMLERIERLKHLDIYPEVVYGTAENYIKWMLNQDITKIPVWKDELYLEYHQGTFTTQAETKKNNRLGEVLLTNTEKFSSFATLTGKAVNRNYLNSAWKTVLFNQFHDILPGSSIREVYIDAEEEYNSAFNIAGIELKTSLSRITEKINTSGIPADGRPLVVFNPLNWERTDIVKYKLDPGDESYSISDLEGNEVASIINSVDEINREIIFVAENVPSAGYKIYNLVARGKVKTDVAALSFRNIIENEYFRVSVDTATGWVSSIYDKKNNREVLSSHGNKLQLLEDRPAAWDAWNVGLTGVEFPSEFRKAELIENNPVRSVIRLHRDYLKPGTLKSFPTETFPSSFFTQDIILYKKIERIDFKTSVDWWEEKTMLKASFPVSVSNSFATYEIPYGSIERSTGNISTREKAQYEMPALKWVDLSDSSYGVSLLNNSKYGFDIKGNNIRMSLLRSPKWPDETADMGKHEIEYALYPHKGTWKSAQTVQKSFEFNYPLVVEKAEIHKGQFPPEHSFLKLEPANLVLTTIKIAEDDNDWVLQFYETSGKGVRAEIELPFTPIKAFISNFLEEELKEVEVKGNIIHIDVKKNSVVTLKIKV